MAAITVAQLRELLANPALPDDAIVVLSEDAEGNGFSPLPAAYVAYATGEDKEDR